MKKEKTYSMSDKKATTGGLSIGTVLFLIFLTLKLAEVGPVANWSWWWVTSPLWLPAVIVFGFFLFVLLLKALFSIFD